jgi:hypothetical protein
VRHEHPPLPVWVKSAEKAKGHDPNAKEVCFTGKDGRTKAGQPVVAAALIEPAGESKKLRRITLPPGLRLQFGARLIIDEGQPISGAFFTCFANGCMADYEATPQQRACAIWQISAPLPLPQREFFFLGGRIVASVRQPMRQQLVAYCPAAWAAAIACFASTSLIGVRSMGPCRSL